MPADSSINPPSWPPCRFRQPMQTSQALLSCTASVPSAVSIPLRLNKIRRPTCLICHQVRFSSCQHHCDRQLTWSPTDEIFQDKYRTKEHIDSFAEAQVKLAKQVLDEHISTGVRLLETVQGRHDLVVNMYSCSLGLYESAQIIIVWWYWCHARYVVVPLWAMLGLIYRAADGYRYVDTSRRCNGY